jgi:F-type H+-transporting ATPase subunit a
MRKGLNLFKRFRLVFITLAILLSVQHSFADSPCDAPYNAGKTIIDHIVDSHEWHFFSIKKSDGTCFNATIPLPCIVYSKGNGVDFFSYDKIADGTIYNGYESDEQGNIVRADGVKVFDFSMTKVFWQLLISALLMVWIFFGVASKYKDGVKAPKGMQSAMEVIVIFIRDEVAKPMMGPKANRYLPFLLTVFFFIWINNMLGVFPGAANVTGNIAITATLALLTFFILIFSSKKHYWKHVFTPPGVPVALYPIMVPVEILGIFTKPFALMIRLFANMTAGHLIVLSFLSMIFIFASKGSGVITMSGISIFSIAFAVFIYVLEMLVALLQAYIFTILSALFIGDAAVDPHALGEHLD